ncbi:SCO family protein [Halovenus sp. HT40]|uniref:SCO family protein n=1 Tax=Halovenus sp. HT40 TaxID=3126691 RepID=UPI00300E9A33
MDRRAYLQASLVTSGVALTGCLSSVTGSDEEENENTVLDPPEREYDVDPEALAYPAYGQALPEATLPSPLHDTEISTREFVDSRETLVTFVFTRCGGPCPALTSTLARVQADAGTDGYSDSVALMPITFDPEYDTPDRLREFSTINGADPTAENWQFLRPESEQRAKEVVGSRGQFGVGFEEVSPEGGGHGGGDRTGPNGEVLPPDEEGENTMFAHTILMLLVNRDGYVERAYTPQPPRPDIVLGDLASVREGYE